MLERLRHGVGNNDFARAQPRQQSGQGIGIAAGDEKRAGRHIGPSDRPIGFRRFAETGQSGDKIMRFGIEQAVFIQRAGGDQPHHFTAHNGF